MRRLSIVQYSRHFESGTGVANVALALEQALASLGHEVLRFDLRCTRFPFQRRTSRNPVTRRVHVVCEALWYGYAADRHIEKLRKSKSSYVTLAHADPCSGDVFVNHGLLRSALEKKRGGAGLIARLAYSPLTIRESRRLSSSRIGAFVSLSAIDDEAVRGPLRRSGMAGSLVIPNGVDVRRFRIPTPAQRAHARSLLGVPGSVPVIAFVGHEFARKGLPTLLEALRRMPVDAWVVVAGGRENQVAALQADMYGSPLLERVLFVGSVSDVRSVYWACDAFCLPSHYEAGQLVLLEALASGLPVVTTPVGNAKEILGGRSAGYIVPGDAESIAQALMQVVKADTRTRAQMEASAREVALEYSWERIALRYVDLLRDAREGRETGG